MRIRFSTIWNESLGSVPDRPYEARDYIWASEIGGAFSDRYLKMRGVQATNPPNARSRRKFEAGNIIEWIVGLVIKRSGLYVSAQDRLTHQYPDLLMVSGKCDFVIGGVADFDKARAEIGGLNLPEMIDRASMQIITGLSGTLSSIEFERSVLEVKSCSDFMFNRYDLLGHANPTHANQCYHYRKCLDLAGSVVYVNKDNLLLAEYDVEDDQEVFYRQDIEAMTYFIENQEMPQAEQEVFFDLDTYKFSKNWKVEYSSYLSMLYGYDTPDQYRARWDKQISSFNRVFKRCVNGDNMTKGNLEAIHEAKKVFPDWDAYVAMAKVNGVVMGDDEE